MIVTLAPIDEGARISEQNSAVPSSGMTIYSEDEVRRLIVQFAEMQQALVRESQLYLDCEIRKLPRTTPAADERSDGDLASPASHADVELPSWLTHRISELEDRRSVWNRLWDMVLGNR